MSTGQSKGKSKYNAKPWWRRRESVLITDAPVAPGQDRHRREIVYGVLMFLRVPSLLISLWLIYAYDAGLIAALISAITIPLPWVAVVFANARGQRRDSRERNTYKPALARPARAEAIASNNATQLEYPDSPRRESDIIAHVTKSTPASPDNGQRSCDATPDSSPSPGSAKDE